MYGIIGGEDYLLLDLDGEYFAFVFDSASTMTLYVANNDGNVAFTKAGIMAANKIGGEGQKSGNFYLILEDEIE